MDGNLIPTALGVLAVDPVAMGGLWLRARASPMRTALIETMGLMPLPIPIRRLAPNIGDDALFGGLDAAATLQNGRPILRRGLLDQPSVLLLPMAERCLPGLSARLAQTLDLHRHALIALDEAASDGEGLPPALADRLGLFLDLDGLRLPDGLAPPPGDQILQARKLLPSVKLPHEAVKMVVQACTQLQIASTRAPMLTLAAARILAALAGRQVVEEPDLSRAAQLTLAHRAAPLPDSPDQSDPPPPPPDSSDDSNDSPAPDPQSGPPTDLLVEAVRAILPDSVLQQLDSGRLSRAAKAGSGSGAAKAGNRRGRPLPSRKGQLLGGARLDLIATLRAAAPWQGMRRAAARGTRANQALLVERGDLHITRTQELSDRVLIFAVDASGSAAVARLAEAKGAVELLLARAYSRRDHVALLTFRGQKAELLLPPSRSLVATKQRLRGLPGGGGTPLASGLQLALDTALKARARGMTPTIALLTDGRGNMALDGSANRALADDQAMQMARAIRAAAAAALVIDVAQRPHPRLAEMALAMQARYIALPRATAGRLADALGTALET